jgi:branched-chain amino acid transport system substrate-binding protein
MANVFMHHSKALRSAFSLLTVGALFLLFGCTSQSSDTGLKTIRIAANLPMTGPSAIYGQAIKEGAELAIEDLKRTDPTGPGFAIDWQDNAGDPQKAVNIFQKHMDTEYDIYWSGVNQQNATIKDQLDLKGMPHFVWVLDAAINNKREGIASIKNNFCCWVNFKIEPSLLLNYANAHKAKNVAIVYKQSPGAEEEYKRTIPALKAMGISNVLVDSYDPASADYKAIASKVKDFKPDLIILSGSPANFVGLIRALKPLDLIHNGNTICSYELLDASELGQDELEGLRVITPMFTTHLDNPGITGWSEHFYKKTNRRPSYTDAYAYDAINMLYAAARSMMLPASSEQWVNALHAVKLNGVTGPLAFDSDGTLCTPVEVGVFQKGVVVTESQLKSAQK